MGEVPSLEVCSVEKASRVTRGNDNAVAAQHIQLLPGGAVRQYAAWNTLWETNELRGGSFRLTQLCAPLEHCSTNVH